MALEVIHLVTGVRSQNRVDVYGKPYKGLDTSCFGWYPTSEQAVAAVLENAADINEGGRQGYIVVEAVPWGVYSAGMISEKPLWFSWFQEGPCAGEGYYRPCEAPQEIGGVDISCTRGWGMG